MTRSDIESRARKFVAPTRIRRVRNRTPSSAAYPCCGSKCTALASAVARLRRIHPVTHPNSSSEGHKSHLFPLVHCANKPHDGDAPDNELASNVGLFCDFRPELLFHVAVFEAEVGKVDVAIESSRHAVVQLRE